MTKKPRRQNTTEATCKSRTLVTDKPDKSEPVYLPDTTDERYRRAFDNVGTR